MNLPTDRGPGPGAPVPRACQTVGVRDSGSFGAPDGWVFDTDGVITRTAEAHRAAWAATFDGFLGREDPGQRPFSDEDYLAHVDGRPRYDGVAGFLASRGVRIPLGTPSDEPGARTVCGVGNAKNRAFLAVLARDGVEPYASTVALVRQLRASGVVVAAVSASRNQEAVLGAAGLTDAFDVRVDGVMAERAGLAGKPDPALFLEAARRLGLPPGRVAVVEDARSGVEAGRRGGFVPVIGVDRHHRAAELRSAGADVVVEDVALLEVAADRSVRLARVPEELP